MKLHKTCQVEKVTSSDRTRPVLSHAFLSGETLIATDGKAMIQLPVERSEGDEDGFVTVEALKAARKEAKRADALELKANGCLALPSGASFPRPIEARIGRWPNCQAVWAPVWEKPVAMRIAFSAELLANLAEAMGTEGVVLEIVSETDAIRVLPTSTRKSSPVVLGAKGILMPICIQ